jgi:dipeptidyl aminopeptidase/acylaminoacyl peptidase
MPNGASAIAWSPSGTHLAFLSEEGKEPEHDPLIVTPPRHVRLWTVHVESDIPTPVTPDDVTVWEYAWSPDGRSFAVYYSVKPDENGWYAGQVGLVGAGGGAIRQLTQLTQQVSSLTWTPDGQAITYISGDWSDRGYSSGDIYLLSLSDSEVSEPCNLTPGISYSPAMCRWFPDGKRLLFTAVSGVTHLIAIRDENGEITTLDDDFVMWDGLFSTPPDMSKILTLHSSPDEMYDLWAGMLSPLSDKPQGETSISWHRETQLNPIIEETYALAKTERIRYESVDDWQIDALLSHPRVRKIGGPSPLVVLVHGGPSSAWIDDMSMIWTQILASAGYMVLRPNIRGSWGRGTEFANAVIGDMGGKDFQDIMRGVNFLIERGLVDGDRLGICGWSYGGFMTAWAVSQTTRFKAAVMGAGIADWHSFHAQSNLSDWDMRYLKANPLDNPQVYRERSPITYAKHVTTPTLILHGELDKAVPVSQGYTFHRALYERGVPTELVVYPREGHGPVERHHLRDIEERTLRWLEQYL